MTFALLALVVLLLVLLCFLLVVAAAIFAGYLVSEEEYAALDGKIEEAGKAGR